MRKSSKIRFKGKKNWEMNIYLTWSKGNKSLFFLDLIVSLSKGRSLKSQNISADKFAWKMSVYGGRGVLARRHLLRQSLLWHKANNILLV